MGAYAAAIFSIELGLPFWLCIPLSGLVAALVGLSVGPFALRLEGLYLAIVTIGLMFLVEHVLRNGLEVVYGKDYLSVPMHTFFAEAGSTGWEIFAVLGASVHGPLMPIENFILFFWVSPHWSYGWVKISSEVIRDAP